MKGYLCWREVLLILGLIADYLKQNQNHLNVFTLYGTTIDLCKYLADKRQLIKSLPCYLCII